MNRHHLRRVLYYCAFIYAHEHCAPSVAAIADATRLSATDVRRALTRLEMQGRLWDGVPVGPERAAA